MLIVFYYLLSSNLEHTDHVLKDGGQAGKFQYPVIHFCTP